MPQKIILYIVTFVCCITLAGCGKPEQSNVSEQSSVSEPVQQVSIPYSDLSLNISVKIPSEWVQTLEGNKFTITEKNTGTYISIIRENYYPEINNQSQDSLAQSYNAQGVSLQSFVKETGNCIKLIASYTTNNIPITEYKYIYWTYDAIYTISYVVETKLKEEFMDEFEEVYTSFKLQKEEVSVSEGYTCIYNPSSKISIEYPVNWKFEAISSGFSVTNQNTQSLIYIENLKPIEKFSEYTQVDYVPLMQSLVSGSSLSSFLNKGDTIYGEAFATSGTTKIWIENILIDKKTYTLSFTFLSVSDYTSVDEPIYAYMLDTIRFYDSEK